MTFLNHVPINLTSCASQKSTRMSPTNPMSPTNQIMSTPLRDFDAD